MTEDGCPQVSDQSIPTATTTAPKQRKKRKWDQPAEVLISAGLAVPGVLPLANMGSLISGALLTNTVSATCTTMPQVSLPASVQHNTATVLQKLIQPKIQDELIAREIVINDAESTVRYRLTKRQTQEEIQRHTGAVVITRGKYRLPNAIPDSEKPLYLHISAGAHLKETAERIKAVDRAAAIVEEMLNQGHMSQLISTPLSSAVSIGGQVSQPLNASVFLGFDAESSLNIASRVRGPNDQYINHIMNETGATVILRGRGSGNSGSTSTEELQQPLHLFLSGNNQKSLESAKLLAENLMDTIAAEFGASRVSLTKGYNAVPPPQQLLDGVQSSGTEQRVNSGPLTGLASSVSGSTPVLPVLSTTSSGVSTVTLPGTLPLPGWLSCRQPDSKMVAYCQPSVGGTSYSGYGGIYPQATPLQQVALVLRQSPSPAASVVVPTTSADQMLLISKSKIDNEKRPPQKRKFQELPVPSKVSENPQNSLQGSESHRLGLTVENSSVRNLSTMPPPMKLVQPSSNGMPPPPTVPSTPLQRTMPPPPPRTMPPPPPKFTPLSKADDHNSVPTKSTSHHVPDTLIKLMEYGDDDDDLEGVDEVVPQSNSKATTAPKPFWAL